VTLVDPLYPTFRTSTRRVDTSLMGQLRTEGVEKSGVNNRRARRGHPFRGRSAVILSVAQLM
jgi:hypothetical protein